MTYKRAALLPHNVTAQSQNPLKDPDWYISAILVFGLLCILRGWTVAQDGNSFFSRTDLIGLATILLDPNYPHETFISQFAHVLETFSVGLRSYKQLISLGISPQTLFIAMTYLEIAAIAIGLTLISFAFRPSIIQAMISCFVVFFGSFFYFGRYLNLESIFWWSYSSGHALSVGLIVIGLLLSKLDRSAALLSGLIALYHPSHGLVALALVASVQFWRLTVAKASLLPDILPVAAIALCLFVPIISYFASKVPPLAGPVEEWWTLAVAIQRVMTPLVDGLLVVLGSVIVNLVAIWLLARPEFHSIADTAGRARAILILILVFLIIQIVSADFLHVTRIAQLVLTRSQPYLALLAGTIVVALSGVWWLESEDHNNRADRIAAVLLIASTIVGEIPLILPYIRLPVFIPPLIRIEGVYDLMVIYPARCVLVLIAALYWSYRRLFTMNILKIDVAYGMFILIYALFLGLRLEVVSVAALLALPYCWRWVPVWVLDLRLITAALVVTLALGLPARPGWAGMPNGADSLALVQKYVPKGSMILVIPPGVSGRIPLMPYYSEYLNSSESKFNLYAPWLTQALLDKYSLLGTNPRLYDVQCPWNPLVRSQCLREKFIQENSRRNDAWRVNLSAIRANSPRLTHVLLLKSHSCMADHVEAEIGQFVLVNVDGVAEAGCT
jgi:hypothetical protein